MSKRMVLMSVVALVALAVVGSSVVWSKAHVPLGRAQVCTAQGEVKNIASRTLGKRLSQGSCRLTACVFNDVDDDDNVVQQFIFLPGDSCDPTDDNGDGFCDSVGSPKSIAKNLKANNVTPACSNPY